jgi:hypothetical protein
MKHFLSIKDVTDLPQLITSGITAKKDPFADQTLGKNKTIGLLFFNSSLRTRISTQKAAQNLGLNVITMNVGQDGWGLEMEEGVIMNGDKAEHVKEAAAVIGSYCDIIGIRSFAGLQDHKPRIGHAAPAAIAGRLHYDRRIQTETTSESGAYLAAAFQSITAGSGEFFLRVDEPHGCGTRYHASGRLRSVSRICG